MSEDYCSPDEVKDHHLEQVSDEAYNMYARCPVCKDWCRAVPHYYANLGKMHSCGPRTKDGRKRSSLNAFKHGMYAKGNNLLAPANGKYDICADCADKEACDNKELKYCPYKLDLMAKFVAAYENGDINAVKAFAGISQARVYMILENMMHEVLTRGVMFIAPKVHQGEVVKYGVGEQNEDGEYDQYEVLNEYSLNPMIDAIPKVMSTLGMSSDQQSMNPAKQVETEESIKGKMAAPVDPINFMNSLSALIGQATGATQKTELASAMRKADIVHQEATSGHDVDDDTDAETDEIKNPFK